MAKLLASMVVGAFTGTLLGCLSGVCLLQSAELGYGQPIFFGFSAASAFLSAPSSA